MTVNGTSRRKFISQAAMGLLAAGTLLGAGTNAFLPKTGVNAGPISCLS